jgi:hypothetical protein
MKSPARREATRPLTRLEIKAKDEHDAAVAEYASREMVTETRRKLAEAALRRAVKKQDADPDAIAADAISEEEPPPVRRRFMVNGPTPEKAQVSAALTPGIAIPAGGDSWRFRAGSSFARESPKCTSVNAMR